MNLWECDERGCKITATGMGGAIGLRAIGWQAEINPGAMMTLRCPGHRTDAYRDQIYGPGHAEPAAGEKCAQCTGDYEAGAWQSLIGGGWQPRHSPAEVCDCPAPYQAARAGDRPRRWHCAAVEIPAYRGRA